MAIANKKGMKDSGSDLPPKRITQEIERVGSEYAWLDKLMVDWGDGKPRVTYRAGFPDGVHVLAFLENGNVLLIHQYRVLGRGWVYELPGGIIDQMESEEAAAIRELEEETGHKALELQKLFSYHPLENAQCTIHLYIARKLQKTKQRLDEGEGDLCVQEVTQTQLYEMILDGTITDSKTVIATLLAKERGLLKVNLKEFRKGHPF